MKSRTLIIWFVFLLLFVKTLPVFCQQIIFNKVLPPEGKTFGMVTCITQDIHGYMWFGTNVTGLYRYDGYRYTSYVHDSSDSHSLAHNYVETINTDSNGIIWVGTSETGLDRLDPEAGIFTHFRHDANVPSSLGCDSITAILIDKQGILWIGTYEGLDQFDPKTNKFIHYRYNTNDSTSISNNLVRAIYEDRQGTLWVGTGFPGDGGRPEEGGLNRMNKKTGSFTRYLNIPGNIHSLANNKVRAIFEDNQGILWIGTGGNGLHKMDRKQGVFERIVYDPAHPEKISGPAFRKEDSIGKHITFITQDAAGSYWIGTMRGGLNYYNPVIGKTIHYSGTENSSVGYKENGAWWTFTSRDGILWISSTWEGGNLYRIDPFRREPLHYTIPDAVICFYEEPNRIFWTGGYKLIRNDIDKGITKRYSLKGAEIRTIKEDRDGNFWLGTTGGLKLYNKKKENFIIYKNDPENTNSLTNTWVNTIYEDRDTNLWIGTFTGFNLRNHKTGSFTQYLYRPGDAHKVKLGGISAILRDKTGKLWISEWEHGVNLFNQESNTFKNYLKDITVSCLYEDADAALWLGGNNGLYRFDRSADAFIRYKVSGSFSEIPDVSKMVEDNQKYLWLQTSEGMMSLNPRRNETRNYGISKPSFGDIGYSNNCYKGRDGKLYFTENGGYYSFYPSDFTQHIIPPDIVFSGFSLGDKLIKPGDKGPLKESIFKTTEIRLRYNQNIFSFEFAAIDYTNPETNRHLFMLENYSNIWQQAGPDRKASYFNIPPGKYVFRVKAINSKGAWAEKKIDIIILPPWWSTWWAYSLFAFLFVTAVWGFIYYRSRQLRRKNRLLEEKVSVRTNQLQLEKEKVESTLTQLRSTQSQLIQSEKMASLGELTAGIAHEIQNPLNFVNNFSEVNKELLAEMNEEIQSGNYEEVKAIARDITENQEKINHHGKRADAIVKGMLQHSQSSTGQKEPTDINVLADEYLRLSYHGLRAKDKTFNATLQTDFDGDVGKINIIPQEIARVLLNLYNNAFFAVSEKKKQQPERYEPTILVTTKKLKDKVVISVKDNGNGIRQMIIDKIFQPFFTTKSTGQGTGLGLSLSYDIIKAHRGEIRVETKEGEFTEFVVQIPEI